MFEGSYLMKEQHNRDPGRLESGLPGHTTHGGPNVVNRYDHS